MHGVVRSPLRVVPWLLASACAPESPPAPPPVSHRNLLVITLDTARRDFMGFHGRTPSPTPHLDAMAADAAVFDDAYSVAPLTLPAHTSLMTGLYPASHSVHDNGLFRVPEQAHTLAEVLAEAGYDCAAEVGAVVLDEVYGLDQGFARYRAPPRSAESSSLQMVERDGGEVIDAALATLAELRPPYFLWVHLFDPHFPYLPHSAGPVDARDGASESVALYEGEIGHADRQIGRLLGALTRRPRSEQCLVVFAADHGEGLNDGLESSHGYLLHDTTLRIPLWIRDPALPGRRIPHPVSLVDVMPTVLGLLGIPTAQPFDGLDLSADLRRDPETSPRALLLESYHGFYSHGWAPVEALVTEEWKLVHSTRDRLYARTPEPDEGNDLAAEQPGRLADLLATLQHLLDQPALRLRPADKALDSGERQRLLQLGYVVGDTARTDSRPEAEGRPDIEDRLPVLSRIEDLLSNVAAGDGASVLAELDQLLQDEPNSAWLHAFYADLMMEQGQHPEAVLPHLQAAVQLQPNEASYHYSLGLWYSRRAADAIAGEARSTATADPDRMFERATSSYRLALSLDPHHLKTLANLAASLDGLALHAYRRHELDEARRLLEEAITLSDRFLELLPDGDPDRERMLRERAERVAKLGAVGG